ncbi:uncharacterized protein MEPE_01171 [Melanopsichium pennsylvanicum]|uniref:Uncharacterized protein n=2 Tax=Melanopsichium pennsylvanicum TaxID=63383 RepID=A0AAJ4XI01_9BASI|nr:putative protein [Melanopsichium pennsylvanicum 4]SNX82465.1 uncharacterized protein MEPE_01171 [Melanopsichium pennsylvanicum]
MKRNLSALVAFSAAALLAATPSSAQIDSLDLGGTSQQASSASSTSSVALSASSAPTSVAASSVSSVSSPTSPSSASAPTSAITAASGSDAPATSTIASDSVSSPAYAAGTVTYIPPPLPTSTSSIDVSLLPSTVSAISATPSSNYSLPNATATGTFLSIPTLQSNPYQIVFADTSGLPVYNWNLAANSSSDQAKTALCASQMQFCQTAGCNDTTATLTNFCEIKYMGVACTCSKGVSRLEQYQWPVMLADCQGRNTACRDACIKPGQGIEDQNNCLNVCADNFGSTCGKPGQYAANYAVKSQGDKPSYTVVQGGTAQNGALGGKVDVGTLGVAVIATVASAALIVGL